MKDRVTEQLVKLDEKLKKLTRMRLEDEITRESYFEFKSEIEKEKLDLLSKRRVLDAGMVPNGNPEDPAKKVEDFLLAKMDFTESYRKERDGMLRQNQWHDLTVRVFM